jgi:hypothetical protein
MEDYIQRLSKLDRYPNCYCYHYCNTDCYRYRYCNTDCYRYSYTFTVAIFRLITLRKIVDKIANHWYPCFNKRKYGKERDKYLLLAYREPRVGATRQQAKAKSTREPARQAPTAAPVNRQLRGRIHSFTGHPVTRVLR